MKLRLKELIITTALLCCIAGMGYGQHRMSFELDVAYANRDSVRYDVIVKNNGASNFILTSVQFMLTYDTSELHVDPVRTVMNHRFSIPGWVSTSSATYRNFNPADRDTLLYRELTPDPTKGVTIPKNAPLRICTITFFDPEPQWDPHYVLYLIGNNLTDKLSGFTTPGQYNLFDPIIGARVVGIESSPELPASSSLHPCYPNPVDDAASTAISFSLASANHTRITVANTLGQTVARLEDGDFQGGTHATSWSPQGLPPGMYFILMELSGDQPQRFVRAIVVR